LGVTFALEMTCMRATIENQKYMMSTSDQKRSKMTGKWAIVCGALVATCGVAVADVVGDCHLKFQPEVSLPACTEIIGSPKFGPDEKAFAYGYRGEARTAAGDLQPAIADFTESIRLKKDNMSAFAGRGGANFNAGNSADSIADYSEAIRLSPRSEELYVERGHVYVESGKEDVAIRDFTEAIRLNPATWRAFNERGAAYFKKGDLVRAREDYTAGIALFPLAQIYLNRGRVYEAQGKTADATEDFRHALLNDPSLVQARDALTRLGAVGATTETDQRVRQGLALAEKSCGSCHALGATGVSPDNNAPAFRDIYRRHPLYSLRAPITVAIHATHDEMPRFVAVSDEEIGTIVAYINSLSTTR
jgi:tetratricopeptide (TPR) repeat protein